jgi:hypothetical protein
MTHPVGSQYLCINSNSPILNMFAQCLINTLLNISAAGLQLLKQLIETELTLIDTALVALILQQEAADVLGQKTQLLANVINAEFDQIEHTLNSLPLGLLDQSCTDWANLNGGINGFLQNEVLPPVKQILFELARIASHQDELGEEKMEYENLKTFLLDIIDLLDLLILEAKCRANATVA